mmetsp:Transcript_4464/g.9057  ORF Transcript_4464/g.9057 Transcript_4464/m.9057 type:complete len:266 (-) Transcript_4464:117-914(-)
MPVQLLLHGQGVNVIGVHAKRVLDLDSDGVERPVYKHLQEAKQRTPPGGRHILRDHQRRADPVKQEEPVTRLNVGEWEGNCCDLHGLVVRHHSVCHLLEGARENGRGDSEHAGVDVLHNELLDPLKHQLRLCVGLLQYPQALAVNASNIHQTILVRCHTVRAVTIGVLNTCKGDSMQHAEKANKGLLELEDRVRSSTRILAKREEGRTRIEPLRPHVVHARGPIPETRIGLRCPKHRKEADKEDKAAPTTVVLEDAIVAVGAQCW